MRRRPNSTHGPQRGAVQKAPHRGVEPMPADAEEIDVVGEAGDERESRRHRGNLHESIPASRISVRTRSTWQSAVAVPAHWTGCPSPADAGSRRTGRIPAVRSAVLQLERLTAAALTDGNTRRSGTGRQDDRVAVERTAAGSCRTASRSAAPATIPSRASTLVGRDRKTRRSRVSTSGTTSVAAMTTS